MTTTLLIDEDHAHDIFAGIVQAHHACRDYFEQQGIGATRAETYFQNDSNLSGAIAKLEAMISQAAKVDQSIPDLTAKVEVNYRSSPVRVGRPPLSAAEKLAKIELLEAQKKQLNNYQEKLAVGKVIRRLRRSLEGHDDGRDS